VEGCVLIALWAFVSWESWHRTLRAALLSLSGFILGLLPSILFGVLVAGADRYWYNMYTLRRMATPSEVVGAAGQWARFESGALYTVSAWIVPAVLFAIALTRIHGPLRRFLVAWLVAAIVGMQVGFWWDWHFFIQILPPLCVASGAGLLRLNTAPWRLVWTTVLGLALVLFGARDARLWLLPPKEISWQIYHRSGYLVADTLASYIDQTTAPNDSIYIAFGQAEIYYLSGRRPAVPTQMYYAHAAYFDAEWPKVITAIQERQPAVIVWVQPPPPNRMSSSQFSDLVLRGYDLDLNLQGIRVYRRKAAPVQPAAS
jgi:hypothetical protein